MKSLCITIRFGEKNRKKWRRVKEISNYENLSSSMQLYTCYIPTRHRVSANHLAMVTRTSDNKKTQKNQYDQLPKNIIHRSKMATCTQGKVPNQLNVTTNRKGAPLSSEPRSSQTELFKAQQVTSVSGIRLGRWTSASEVSHASGFTYCRASRSQKRSCSVVIGKGDMLWEALVN